MFCRSRVTPASCPAGCACRLSLASLGAGEGFWRAGGRGGGPSAASPPLRNTLHKSKGKRRATSSVLPLRVNPPSPKGEGFWWVRRAMHGKSAITWRAAHRRPYGERQGRGGRGGGPSAASPPLQGEARQGRAQGRTFRRIAAPYRERQGRGGRGGGPSAASPPPTDKYIDKKTPAPIGAGATKAYKTPTP